MNIFQFLLFIFCIAANVVILAGIYWKKTLHRLTFYPVVLQSICDLVAVGIFGIYPWAESLFKIPFLLQEDFDYENDGIMEKLQKRWSRIIRSYPGLNCFLFAASEHMNEYGTGPCMLVIAIERYFIVCHARDTKRGRFRNFMIALNCLLTCVVMLSTGAFTYFTFKGTLDCFS